MDELDFGGNAFDFRSVAYTEQYPQSMAPVTAGMASSGTQQLLDAARGEQYPQSFWQSDTIQLADGTTFSAADNSSDSAANAETDSEAYFNGGGLLANYAPLEDTPQSTRLLREVMAESNYPQSTAANPNAAPQTQGGMLDGLLKQLGPQGVAALITGGFSMLKGAGEGLAQEKILKTQKQRRDEEWARKDSQSYAGNVQRKTWNRPRGILGEAVK